jgi:hypothetical protein
MTGWEYTIVDISGLQKDVDGLNRLGADGWEAVGMVSTWGAREWRFVHPVVLMKRPLPAAPAAGESPNR